MNGKTKFIFVTGGEDQTKINHIEVVNQFARTGI